MEGDEKKCPECAETIKVEAIVCRFCHFRFNDPSPSWPPRTKSGDDNTYILPSSASESEPVARAGESPKSTIGRKIGIGCLVLMGVFIGLAVLGAILGPEKGGNIGQRGPTTSAEEVSPDRSENGLGRSNLTEAQNNAVRSAEQYLAISGFSRDGLIQQLSSSAGNGYSVADATAAVDSLNVDWNENAAKSAKQYTNISGFSCKGLIEQLSSRAGSKYTVSQATYGAHQAGAC